MPGTLGAAVRAMMGAHVHTAPPMPFSAPPERASTMDLFTPVLAGLRLLPMTNSPILMLSPGDEETPRPPPPASGHTAQGPGICPQQPTTDPRLRRALAEVADLNTFFAVDTDPAHATYRLDHLWRREELLAGQIQAVRAGLAQNAGRAPADIEHRAAASICYQGLAARLLCPAIATALCHGLIAPPATLRWQAVGQRLLPALGQGPGLDLDAAKARAQAGAEAIAQHVLAGALTPLAQAVRSHARLAPRLLHGNAASALAQAAHTLAMARPRYAAEARALADALLNSPPLRGLGAFAPAGADQDPTAAFTRRTCCLYYRLPGGALCGDCAIAARTRPA